MKKLLFASVLTASAGALGATGAAACSCAPAPSPEAHIDGFDDIFAGQIVSGSLISGTPGGPGGGGGEAAAVVAVSTVYKGDAGGVALVKTALSSATCGVALTVGANMTFFATQDADGSYGINLCGQLPFSQDPAGFQTALEGLDSGGGLMRLDRPIELNQRFRLVPVPSE